MAQVVERFPDVVVTVRAANPFVDAPVDAAPPAGAAAPELGPELEPARGARRFPGARMADLAKHLVPSADVPAGAAAPEAAQAALRFLGVA